jgi:hypothetical protein
MLTLEERRQLMRILLEDSAEVPIPDVSNRSRDEKGRFLPERKREESRSPSGREIKLVKVKGSYNSYRVKTRWLSKEEKIHLYLVFGFIALAIAV